jgi:hypothetical protein
MMICTLSIESKHIKIKPGVNLAFLSCTDQSLLFVQPPVFFNS